MSEPGPFQNPDTREYWALAREGRVMIQRCRACAAAWAYPRPYCMKCFSDDVALEECEGQARVYARTVVQLPMTDDGVAGHIVVLLDLHGGVRLPARFEGPLPDIGQPVRLGWDFTGDKPRLTAQPV